MTNNLLKLKLLQEFEGLKKNPTRASLIQSCLNSRDVVLTNSNALGCWAPTESTGRIPKQTFIVNHGESIKDVDWSSDDNNPLEVEKFDELLDDIIMKSLNKDKIYQMDRVLGADPQYSYPVSVFCDKAISALFVDNMFRPSQNIFDKSIFKDKGFTLIVLTKDKIDLSKYPYLKHKEMLAMDFERGIGFIYGSQYLGCIKKTLFTVLNNLLPKFGILPLHCSAHEKAILLGLSGTGKTTLSADPNYALIGDDEHGWSNEGVYNFEYGCYAKLINLSSTKEPEIYKATFDKRPLLENGVILENAMVYPDGTFDLDDDRLTQNSRASFPIRYLQNYRESSLMGHPKVILFLTADAYGVLPPVAKLDVYQAMLWFMMGYTSKLAGTEKGITEPKPVFSRFFGGPFMPLNPEFYTSLLRKKIENQNIQVFLINTGWTGGPYGKGKRIDISTTRYLVNKAIDGTLGNMSYEIDERFHLNIPIECPGMDSYILNPRRTWESGEDYDLSADKLASLFSEYFDSTFLRNKIDLKIIAQCPGK